MMQVTDMRQFPLDMIKHNINNPNFDFHLHTASMYFKCDITEVTDEQRNYMKELNMLTHQFIENIQGGQNED